MNICPGFTFREAQEVLKVIRKVSDGWWLIEAPNGKSYRYAESYIEMLLKNPANRSPEVK